MQQLNDILKLPQPTLLNRKITKAFFKRNFDLTISERSLLDDFSVLMGFDWLATVGTNTANITVYQDDTTTFEEVQVISVQIGASGFDQNKQKVAELVQKYIPYHILLCVYSEDLFSFHTADKRINQNDRNRRTIEKRYFSENLSQSDLSNSQHSFLTSLAFDKLDKTNLKTYFDSYTQCIVALQTANLSGAFAPRTRERSQTDMRYLEEIEGLTKEISVLQGKAKKETQLSMRVELNTQIQRNRQKIEQLKTLLTA